VTTGGSLGASSGVASPQPASISPASPSPAKANPRGRRVMVLPPAVVNQSERSSHSEEIPTFPSQPPEQTQENAGQSGVAEVARLPTNHRRKSGDFRYTPRPSVLMERAAGALSFAPARSFGPP